MEEKKYFEKLFKQILEYLSKNTADLKDKTINFPVEDGAACVPESHEALYEDSNIRALNVTIAAGQTEKPHRHERHSIMFVDQPAALEYFHLENEVYQKKFTINDPNARVMNMDPEPSKHYLSNTDNKDYCAFRIEFKKDFSSLSNDASDQIQKDLINLITDELKTGLINHREIRQQLNSFSCQQSTSLLFKFPHQPHEKDEAMLTAEESKQERKKATCP